MQKVQQEQNQDLSILWAQEKTEFAFINLASSEADKAQALQKYVSPALILVANLAPRITIRSFSEIWCNAPFLGENVTSSHT